LLQRAARTSCCSAWRNLSSRASRICRARTQSAPRVLPIETRAPSRRPIDREDGASDSAEIDQFAPRACVRALFTGRCPLLPALRFAMPDDRYRRHTPRIAKAADTAQSAGAFISVSSPWSSLWLCSCGRQAIETRGSLNIVKKIDASVARAANAASECVLEGYLMRQIDDVVERLLDKAGPDSLHRYGGRHRLAGVCPLRSRRSHKSAFPRQDRGNTIVRFSILNVRRTAGGMASAC